MTTQRASLAPIRKRLPNGATVLVNEARTTPAVNMSVSLEAGSLFDPADTHGLAYFLGRIIDRGTVHRTGDEIAETLDLRGVSLGVHVTRHRLALSCTCLSEDFQAVLDVVAEIVREPACLEHDVVTRRGEILTSIRQDDDNPAVQAIARVMALLYGADHRYGRRGKGTTESVGRIERAALLRFHADRVVPATLSAVIVGDVDASAAVDAVARAFDGWQVSAAPSPPLDAPEAATGRRRDVLTMMNKAQADLAYGFVTIPRADPAYHAYWLMANVLGQYGMGGRLGNSIREQQGMAYYAFCSFEADRLPGPLVVRAGVNAANVDRALESIDGEIARMGAEGVTDTELDNSKRYLTGSLPRTLETNAGIAGFLQSIERFDLGLDYDRRLPGLLEAVTRDQVNAAAARTLSPERAAVVIAGPYENREASSP